MSFDTDSNNNHCKVHLGKEMEGMRMLRDIFRIKYSILGNNQCMALDLLKHPQYKLLADMKFLFAVWESNQGLLLVGQQSTTKPRPSGQTPLCYLSLPPLASSRVISWHISSPT